MSPQRERAIAGQDNAGKRSGHMDHRIVTVAGQQFLHLPLLRRPSIDESRRDVVREPYPVVANVEDSARLRGILCSNDEDDWIGSFALAYGDRGIPVEREMSTQPASSISSS
jgi:hypothetical protein